MLNIKHGDLGLRLHQLAVQLSLMYPIEVRFFYSNLSKEFLQKIFLSDPLFEDLILNEMPDVGLLRLKAHQQRNLPSNDLEEKAQEDLTAYVRCFLLNETKIQSMFFL